MRVRHLMTMRFCLSLGAALGVTSVLATHRGQPAGLEGPGLVFVYFPSLCAADNDSRDCHEVGQPVRPGFESMAACMAYANVQLQKESNPKLMASCMKEREV